MISAQDLLLLTQAQAHEALRAHGITLVREEMTLPPRGARENCILRVVRAQEENGGMALLLSGFLRPCAT